MGVIAASKLIVYFRERFPIAGVVLVSVSFGLFSLGLEPDDFGSADVKRLFLLSFFFAAFLLRQRVVDEFKDMRHDKKFFPGRPFQRGIVTKNDLIVLGVIATATEMLMVYLLSSIANLEWYIPAFVYSLLMAKEFFISKWLETRFTTYFIVHELIFLWLGVWIIMIADTAFSATALAWLLSFIFAMMSVEIARKFEKRVDPMGTQVNDTYPAVWGEENTRNILELLIVTAGISYAFAKSSLIIALLSAVTALSLNVLKPNERLVKIIVIEHLLGIATLGVIL